MEGAWSVALLAVTNRRRGGLPAKALAAVPPDCPDSLVAPVALPGPRPGQRYADAAALARVLDLSLYPRTQKLLDPPTNDWRRTARRWPLCAMLAAGLVPNVLAGWFNFTYNFSEVITREGRDAGTARSVSLYPDVYQRHCVSRRRDLIHCARSPRACGLRNDPLGTPHLSDDEMALLRRHTLKLGHYGVRIGVGLWVGEVLYPLLLRWKVPELPAAEFRDLFAHFLASLTVCGLIAAAYPFFLGSALGTGAFLSDVCPRGHDNALRCRRLGCRWNAHCGRTWRWPPPCRSSASRGSSGGHTAAMADADALRFGLAWARPWPSRS